VPLALRAWLRYLIPLTLLAIIACVPLLWIAWRWPAPPDVQRARIAMRITWALAATAWIWQLWLVAGVAPAVQSIVDGTPLSQARALIGGLRGLATKLIPVVITIFAITMGTVALVVPGVLLLVLLSTTGATESHAEAIAVGRANMKRLAITLAVVIVGALVIALACQLAIVPAIGKKVAASKLLPIRGFTRVVALSLTAYAPLAACAIAAVTARRDR
jgi:hypothetical protein